MSKANILVAEAERTFAAALKTTLKHSGYGVVAVVPSGEEAVRAAERHPPDLLLLAIELEGEMDGIEAARQIRARLDIPVVYLTASDDAAMRERAKSTEPIGYILKPYPEQGLLTTVELALHQYRTSRQRAAAALRQSENTARAFLEATGDSVLILDPDGRILTVNEPAARRLGRRVEELLGHRIYDFLPPELAQSRKARIDQVVRSGQPAWFEDERAGIWFESSVYPIVEDGGGVARLAVCGRDISQRKRAEAELRTSHDQLEELVARRTAELTAVNARLRDEMAERERAQQTQARLVATLEATPDFVGFADARDGHILYINRAGRRMTGLAEHEDVTPLKIADVHPEGTNRLMREEAMPTAVRAGVWTGECAFQHRDGHEIPVLMVLVAQKSPTGEVEVFATISRDITERKRAEAALRQADEALERRIAERTAELATANAALQAEVTGRDRTEDQLRRANRNLRMIGDCNEALVHARSEDELLRQICQTIAEAGGYRLAWVGFAESDAAKSIRPVAQAGFESGYLEALQLTWADTERGRGPAGTALRTGQPCLIRDMRTDPCFAPWREQALAQGLTACLGLPLVSNGQPFGVLVMYAVQPEAFGEAEVKLLAELAADLAYGLTALRTRAARTQAEQAVAQSEARYRSLVETSPDAIVLADAEMRLLMMNGRGADLIGHERAKDLLGQSLLGIFPPSEQPRAIADFRKVMAGGSASGLEYAVLRQDGTTFAAELNASAIQGAPGQPGACIVVVRDITDRRRAEAALRASAAQYHTTLDSMSDAIYVLDPDLRFVLINQTAQRWAEKFGLGPVGLGRELFEVMPFLSEEVREAYRHVFATGITQVSAVAYRFGDKEIFAETRRIPILEGGKTVRVVTVIRDVTEQKELEANFLRAQRLEGLGQLAGGLAHDLNNLLTPLVLGAQLVREKLTDPSARALVDSMAASAQRGADIVKQMLTFARGALGERMPLRPRHLVQAAAEVIRLTFPKSITVEVDLPQNLRGITGDATQIHQVLMNLCLNARDAMPQGGTLTLGAQNLELAEARARLRSEAHAGSYVVFTVRDTGTGIAPEVLDRIFEPFFTTKGVGKGSGLGLSTTLGIAKSHGGFVEVHSQAGQGAEFSVFLPAAPGEEDAEPAQAADPSPAGQGEMVLVVDDEMAVREVLAETLEAYGYRVLMAGDGAEAAVTYAQHRQDIKAVLTDLAMPGMDGVGLTRVLRAQDPQLPILVSTGLGQESAVAELKGLGVEVFLVKPYTADPLLDALQKALGRRT